MKHWRYELTALPDGGYRARRVLVDDGCPNASEHTYAARLEVPADTPKGLLLTLVPQLMGAVCRDMGYRTVAHTGREGSEHQGQGQM